MSQRPTVTNHAHRRYLERGYLGYTLPCPATPAGDALAIAKLYDLVGEEKMRTSRAMLCGLVARWGRFDPDARIILHCLQGTIVVVLGSGMAITCLYPDGRKCPTRDEVAA